MKFKVHFHINDTKDYFVVEADLLSHVERITHEFFEVRGLDYEKCYDWTERVYTNMHEKLMNNVSLRQRLNEMNLYWQEIKDRPDNKLIAEKEIKHLMNYLPAMDILLIVGDCVNNIKGDKGES